MPTTRGYRPRRRRVLIAATGAILLASAAAASAAPPTLTGPGSGSSPWTNSPAFSWTSGGGTGAYTWSVDGGSPTATTGTSVVLTGLSEGSHTFAVTEDGTETAQAAFTVDTTAPTATSSPNPAPNANGWYGASIASVAVTHGCAPGAGAPLANAATWPRVDTLTATGTALADGPACADVAGNTATPSSFNVQFDRVAPVFTLAATGGTLNATSGWYTAGTPTANYTCTDSGGSNLDGTCPADVPVTAEGVFSFNGGQIADRAGNQSAAIAGTTIRRDTVKPTVPVLTTLGPVTNQVRPTFQWGTSSDATSGVAGYRIALQAGNTVVYQTPAASLIPQSAGDVVTLPLPVDLVNGTAYTWQVTAFDVAGNSVPSLKGAFSVDTSAPNPPTLTAGPTNGGATSDNTPTFTFGGLPGAQFRWQLKSADGTMLVPLTAYADATTFTSASLPDGVYTFEVRQRAANGLESGFQSALFTVDTVLPGAPTVTSSPGTTGSPQPSFGWKPAEQGGSFNWEVTGSGGVRVLGPGDTSALSVQLPAGLKPGSYVFRVRQRDRAGNASDWSAPEPFTVVTASSTDGGGTGGTATGPGTGTGTEITRFKPSTRNANLLFPRVGTVVKPAKTVLSWKRARGATLYNIQIFLINGTSYRKVHSAFPRRLQYQVPQKVLKPGKRYAWRVWPYLGAKRKYSQNPLGFSWFDTPGLAKSLQQH